MACWEKPAAETRAERKTASTRYILNLLLCTVRTAFVVVRSSFVVVRWWREKAGGARRVKFHAFSDTGISRSLSRGCASEEIAGGARKRGLRHLAGCGWWGVGCGKGVGG